MERRAGCLLYSQNFADGDPIRAVQIQTLAGEPVLRIRPEGRPGRLSSLGLSGPALELDESKARAIVLDATQRIIGHEAQPVFSETIERDQWTVGDAGRGNRPLFPFPSSTMRNAPTAMCPSTDRAKSFLWTTAAQRFWNWLGAPSRIGCHFTELRKQRDRYGRVDRSFGRPSSVGS